MLELLKSLMKEEQGQDMVEYALILGFVAVAAAAVIATVGSDVKVVWNVTSGHMSNSASTALGS